LRDLPRLHLMEFHEQSWIPENIRSDVQIVLSDLIKYTRMYDAILPKIVDWLTLSDSHEILDLCAGAGGPALVLLKAMKKQGRKAPRFILSDLYPNIESMTRIRKKFPSKIRFISEPVDATSVGEHGFDVYGKPRARSYIACFHHFSPELAKGMLADAVKQRAPVMIVEPLTRQFRSMFSVVVAAHCLVPLIQLMRAPFAPGVLFRLPMVSSILAVDGVVSAFRTYTPEQLQQMVDELDADYDWEIGVASGMGGHPLGKICPISYCFGVPR